MPPPLEGFSTRDQLILTKITSRILVLASELSMLRRSALRAKGIIDSEYIIYEFNFL